jgi:SAM-dependent methyltransferase
LGGSWLSGHVESLQERGLQVDLYQARLQELSMPHRYDAIMIPTGSFLLIENREESLQVLRKLYEHLLPGGRLIVDLEMHYLPSFQLGKVWISTFRFPNGDIITQESKLTEVNLLEQYYVSYLKYEKWRNGALLQTELERFALRWYGVEEFKMILEKIGFTEIVISADYVYGQEPTSHRQTFTFEAVRR